MSLSVSLRPYQSSIIEEVRNSYRRSKKAPLLVAPTGSGKTVMFCSICESASSKGNKVGILVHRQELIDQTSESLSRLGIQHGIIAPDHPRTFDPVQIASVHTLGRRLENGAAFPFDLLIVDEAHHATAGAWRKVINHLPQARILGVTATPERLDRQPLNEIFDDMILGPSVTDLIDGGFLSPFDCYIPPTPDLDLSGVRKSGGDYQRKELGLRVDKPTITGSAVEHYSKICPNRPAIAFCVSIEHARHVADQFRSAGFISACVDGTMKKGERRKLIADLGAGRIHVLTSCEIISEGTDIPIVEAAILLRPTQSLTLHLQQCGRVLRPAPGKERAIILDHVGNLLRLGLPDEPREWSLEGRPKKEKTIAITSCPKCYLAHRPAPSCPHCGFDYQSKAEAASAERVLQFREGELKKLTAEDRLALQQKRKQEQRRCQTLEELVELGRSRGYKFPVQWAQRLWGYKQKYKKRVA